MWSERLRSTVPYAVLFAVAAWFHMVAGRIEYSRQGDNFGPDIWPRAILTALMLICAIQSVRLLFIEGSAKRQRPNEDVAPEEAEGARSYPLLLLGLGLTIAYGALLPVLGFPTGTLLYTALFIYVGRYRAHFAIWISSGLGAVLLTLLFQKVVYVSLPRGIYPFDQITDGLLRLF